jgi:hypothetical protein
MQLARDAARAFIAASLSGRDDATVVNLPGARVALSAMVEAIVLAAPESAGSIGWAGEGLSFPDEVDASGFAEVVPGFEETPLLDGVRETVERFRALLADGLVTAPPVA